MQHYLIIGLGNPGADYTLTRHNAGFRVLDTLATTHQATFAPARLASKASCTHRGRKLTLLKPTTYMNRSGQAVRYWMQALKVPLTHTLIITDDLALPVGHLRLRTRGGDGGHNGLQDIATLLQTTTYPRLRIGIGHAFAPGGQAAYVLAPFTQQEEATLTPTWQHAQTAVHHYCFHGITHVMNHLPRLGKEVPTPPPVST